MGTFNNPGILTVPSNFAIYEKLLKLMGHLPQGVPAIIGAMVLHNPMLGIVGWISFFKNVWPFNKKGEVRVDQGAIGDHELMALISNEDDKTVSFITHRGYLRVDDGPHDHNNLGNTVDARATQIEDSSKWYLEPHPEHPGSPTVVAVRSKKNGLYLTNWRNLGDRLSAEGQKSEINQVFFLDFVSEGRCVLRAPQDNPITWTKYVSVA